MKLFVARSCVVGLAVAAAAAPAALAHDQITGSTPRNGQTLTTLPATVTVKFGEQIGRVESIRVTRAGSRTNYVTSAGINPRNVAWATAKLRSVGPAGAYTVTWAVRAADGHRQTGTFRFRTTKTG